MASCDDNTAPLPTVLTSWYISFSSPWEFDANLSFDCWALLLCTDDIELHASLQTICIGYGVSQEVIPLPPTHVVEWRQAQLQYNVIVSFVMSEADFPTRITSFPRRFNAFRILGSTSVITNGMLGSKRGSKMINWWKLNSRFDSLMFANLCATDDDVQKGIDINR